jgi:hypothetical protein
MILCPDYKNNQSLKLSDDGTQMITSTINIYFARCNPLILNRKSDEEIDEFIRNLKIVTYSLNE